MSQEKRDRRSFLLSALTGVAGAWGAIAAGGASAFIAACRRGSKSNERPSEAVKYGGPPPDAAARLDGGSSSPGEPRRAAPAPPAVAKYGGPPTGATVPVARLRPSAPKKYGGPRNPPPLIQHGGPPRRATPQPERTRSAPRRRRLRTKYGGPATRGF